MFTGLWVLDDECSRAYRNLFKCERASVVVLYKISNAGDPFEQVLHR